MKTTELNQQERDVIEAMIDKHNLAEVLWAIATVCAEKAGHINDNWQDHRLACHWMAASTAVQEVSLPDVPGIQERFTELEPVAD